MLMHVAVVACAGTPPAGQPELGRLSADSLAAFHAEFDAHPDEHRVLVLLSPT